MDLFGLVGCLVSQYPRPGTRLSRGRVSKLKPDNFTCWDTQKEQGDHDFYLSWSYYTDTDPTNRERFAGAGVGPTTSSPGVGRSTD